MIEVKTVGVNSGFIWQKTIATFCFLALIVSVVIAWNNPATGFELDIYFSTPIFTWIFNFLAMLGGVVIIIDQVRNRGYETSRTWLLGLLILIFSQFCFLYIPYIRNYITWGGDNISHWGLMKDVLNTGHFYTQNYYPVTHSILSQLILVTNIPIQLVANISTAFLSDFFILSTYLLATVIFPFKGQQIIAAAIAATVMVEGGYHVFLMPNGWSIFLLPFLFYLYFRRQSYHIFGFLFIVLLVMYPYFHPLSSLLISIGILAFGLFGNFTHHFINKDHKWEIFSRSSLIASVIELLILITWILSFNIFQINIKSMWETTTSGGGEVLGKIGDSLSKMNIHSFDLGILYIKLYGADTILIILSLIGLILIFRQVKKAGQDLFSHFVIYIGSIFLIFGLIYLLYLTGMLGLRNIGAERMIAYTMIFTPVLAATVIFQICHKNNSKILNYILILALIIIPAGLSLRGLYYSPYILQPNIQITAQEMAGMSWMIANKNLKINCLNISNPPSRVADAILGSAAAMERYDLNDIQFADHFGYQEHSTLGDQYFEDNYSGITKMDKIIYSTVWKTVGRFDDSDFILFDQDTSVNKLYSNDDMDVFYIQSMRSSEK